MIAFILVIAAISCEGNAASVPSVSSFQGACRDMIGEDICKSYLALGLCEQEPKRMSITCTKTCGICSACEDRIASARCQELKSRGVCTASYRRMKKLCPRTCGYCPWNCLDQRLDCKKMAMFGNCSTNVAFMRTTCPSSCGYCGARTPCDDLDCPLTTPCELDQDGTPSCKCKAKCESEKLTGPVCGHNGTHEATFDNLCAMLKEECNSENFYTVRHYGHCFQQATCKDEMVGIFGDACVEWKNKGACVTHRGVMQFYCPKTCRLCRQPAPPPICRKSKFGCCWNSDVAATGKYGQGCKTCKDMAFCGYFALECGNARNVAHMRAYCPGLCRYCLPKVLIDKRLAK